jgi:uncharacterized protein YegP (UPF0339 family)
MRFNDGEDAKFYQDRANKWRWRLVHDNKKIIAASCQGYVTKQSCLDNFSRVVMKGREVEK